MSTKIVKKKVMNSLQPMEKAAPMTPQKTPANKTTHKEKTPFERPSDLVDINGNNKKRRKMVNKKKKKTTNV